MIQIRGRKIGAGSPSYIIAEVAQAHDGSLGAAHAFIDLAADAGADAIKFQTHFAEAESTRDEPFRIKFTTQDETRFDYWKRMEFTEAQWEELATHAEQRKITFLSSAFSQRAIDLLTRLNMPAWKIASGEVWNTQFIESMKNTGNPILLSTGMANWQEITDAINTIRHPNLDYPLGIFQCTSMYPTPLTHVGLNVLSEISSRFQTVNGLSDHTGSTSSPMAAIAMGADMIEVHIALHERQFGPDTVASLIPSQLKSLCRFRDDVHSMQSSPVDKDAMAAELGKVRSLFSRSIALVSSRSAGDVLQREDLTTKKPGSGIPASRLEELIGKTLAVDVSSERLLRIEDLMD